MMWRLVFGPSRFCGPDAMFLGEGARHFGRRLGLRISSEYRMPVHNKNITRATRIAPP